MNLKIVNHFVSFAFCRSASILEGMSVQSHCNNGNGFDNRIFIINFTCSRSQSTKCELGYEPHLGQCQGETEN